MFRLLLLVVFNFSIVLSQNSLNEKGEKSGIWFGYHKNGKIKYKGEFINGKEKGVFNYYDHNGNLAIRLNYVEIGTSSQATLYHSNGVLKATGEYFKKQKQGAWIYYNRYSKKINKENYSNGKLNGECVYFYENGQVSEKYNYLNDVKEGEGEIYYQSGFLNMKCNYHINKLHGLALFYYDDTGQLESKGKYNMGIKDSIWVFFNEIGDTLNFYDYRKKENLIKN